jgi:signal transduction histidine kinase
MTEDGDATAQTQSGEALQTSERNLRKIVESSLTAICIHQGNRVVYKNPAYDELVGPVPGLFRLTDFSYIHPDDVKTVRSFYEALLSGKKQAGDVEFRFYPPEGTGGRLGLKWAHCRGTRIEFQGEQALLFNFVEMTKTREWDNLINRQDRMASLGRVASAITHDIRNALSSLNIYVHALQKTFEHEGEREKERQILKEIRRASDRIEAVVKTVRDFVKPGEPKLELWEVNAVVEESILLCSTALDRDGITLEKALGWKLPQCFFDRSQIHRVLLNLIMNAGDAVKKKSGDNRRVEVSTSLGKKYIRVAVSDNGPGIPPHLREMVFDPFYSTKDEGTGIGLAVSLRIVQDHGGLLYARESRWGGAEFVFELPRKAPGEKA